MFWTLFELFDGINSSGHEMDPTLTEQNMEAIVKNTTKNVLMKIKKDFKCLL